MDIKEEMANHEKIKVEKRANWNKFKNKPLCCQKKSFMLFLKYSLHFKTDVL